MKCGINIILRFCCGTFYYGNGKSNRDTVIVVKRVFSLVKTIVVDVFVIYIPRIPLWYFLLWVAYHIHTVQESAKQRDTARHNATQRDTARHNKFVMQRDTYNMRYCNILFR